MTSGTVITDYLGVGLAAARPATPPVPTGGTAFYYSTDVPLLEVWDGSAWQSVGGGGGSGAPNYVFNPIPTGGSAFGSLHASNGNLITPNQDMTVTELSALITTVNSATYKLGIAPYNPGTNQITSAPNYTATYTEGGASGAANKAIALPLTSPLALTAGVTYIIFIVRTDGTTTTSMTLNDGSSIAYSPGIFMPTSGVAFSLSSQAPTTGDTWSSAGSGNWGLGCSYFLT